MRPAVGIQSREIEIRRFVHIAAILSSQREVPSESVVCTGAVNECASRLGCRTGEAATEIPGGIEYQGSAACQRIRLKPGEARQFHHSRASDLVNVGLHASTSGAEVHLRVAVVTVICLGGEPAVNVVAIAEQKSARVGSVLLNSVSVRVLREEPRALDTNF